MTFTQEPIAIVPRMLPRRWGRDAAPAWCATAPRPEAAIGEIWLAHANNMTSDGRHLGERLADAPREMLGELGRVAPSIRVVITDEPSDAISSDGAVSMWRMLEAPLDSVVGVRNRDGAPTRQVRARRGDMFRAEAGASLAFGGGVIALETRANFAPLNWSPEAQLRRLDGAPDRAERATWFRDVALSVEQWTLPELSLLEPDGETCHVLVALTPGAALDGRQLNRGDTVLLPAQGRRCVLSGRGAQMLIAYPDLAPTEIWKRVHPPGPAALAVDPRVLAPKDVVVAHAHQRRQPHAPRAV